jgi:dTDP-4-dehydrorhamnose 3,5-epimerase-like enzyme
VTPLPRFRITPTSPEAIRIPGVVVIPRVFHQDPRGMLIETLRADDLAVDGQRFRMTYTSLTAPGEFRDRDRWHLHARQTDRMVVVLGEMILALHDGRQGSPTVGRLEVVLMSAPDVGSATHPARNDRPSHLVTVPPGVHHCIGNLSKSPFVLQNFPTEYFDPSDEGRIPFDSIPIPALGVPFSWDLVAPPTESAPRAP